MLGLNSDISGAAVLCIINNQCSLGEQTIKEQSKIEDNGLCNSWQKAK